MTPIAVPVSSGVDININKNILNNKSLAETFRNDLKIFGGRKPQRWVFVEVEEAYIHCSKHIPLMEKRDKKIHWGTDAEAFKKGDFFITKK